MTTPASNQPNKPCHGGAGTMTCKECVEFLLDYLDCKLPGPQRASFESHLAICPDCRTYIDNYRKAAALTAGAGGSVRGEEEAELPRGLVEAILKARRERR